MGPIRTLKKLNFIRRIFFTLKGVSIVAAIPHQRMLTVQSVERKSISGPIIQSSSLQLEIGAPLAISLLDTKEFAFLEDTPGIVPQTTTTSKNHLNLTIDANRRTPEDGNAKAWPHPLRSSPTKSGAPRLPELSEHQKMSFDAVELPYDDERPTVSVVTSESVQGVKMIHGEGEGMPPAIPVRSPSRLQARRSLNAAL